MFSTKSKYCRTENQASVGTDPTSISAPTGASFATVYCADAWNFYGSEAAAGEAVARAADDAGALSGIPVGNHGKIWVAAQASATTVYIIWEFEA